MHHHCLTAAKKANANPPKPPRLADSFARAGFPTVAPDLFAGQPAPNDLNDPSFNSTAFLAAHGPDVTDPLVEAAIRFTRARFNVTKLAVTGYCFGGRYAFRFVDPAREAALRADVAFAAHPSAWTDDEVRAIGAPTSVAAAGKSPNLCRGKSVS